MIHGKLIRTLRKLGCNVTRVPKGLKNGEVYALAKKEERILLTQDQDFCDSKRYPPQSTEGIVCLRIFPPTLARLSTRLSQFVSEIDPDDLKGKLEVLS